MSDLIESLLSDAKTILISVVVLVGIVFVLTTWMRTKSVMPTIGAVLLAVVVIWGVTNAQQLADTVDDEMEDRLDDPSGRIDGL